MKPILEIENISKKFRIRHLAGGYLSLREQLTKALKFGNSNSEDFWALNDISFNVDAGESVAIIGRNGAGKSTLLKVLAQITPPTKGRIVLRGRVASLLEVGTGFHPELTGRENVYFNGSLLGMKRAEIASKFDEIVNFSGTEKFLDTPLKHYSSGMQLRLAFSVAAFLEPEILIVDEVLAVGDSEFQKKCIGKMQDVRKSGRTILFVSHNLAAVEALCRKAVLLDKGKILHQGTTNEVLQAYQSQWRHASSADWERQKPPSSALSFTKLSASLKGDQPRQKLEIAVQLKSNEAHPPAFIAVDFTDGNGYTFMQAIPTLNLFINHSDEEQNFLVEVDLPPLVPGTYYLSFWVGPHNTTTFDIQKDVLAIDVDESPTPGRLFPHTSDHGHIVPISTVRKV